MRKLTRYHWVVLGLASIGEWSNALGSGAVPPLAPLFQPELGLTKAEVGFFSTAAFAGAWGVLLITGSLTDRFGVRKILSTGQILTGTLMVSMAMVGSFLQAAVVMFVAGLGRAATGTAPTKVISEWFPPSTRATAMGLKQTANPIAGIFAASALPILGVTWGWRSAIVFTGLVILLGGVLTALLYRPPIQPGVGKVRGWSMRADLSEVARNGYLWKLSIMNLILVTVQFGLTIYLAIYFKEVVLVPWVPDESARVVAAGGYLALCQVGGIFGRLFWGPASDRFFNSQRVVVVAIVGALMALLSAATGYLDAGYPLWFATVVIFAFGFTAVGWGALYQVLITEVVGRRFAATAVGFSMTVSQIGKVVGPPLFGFVVDVSGGYRLAWMLLALLSAVGAMMAFMNIKGEKHVE